VSDHILPNHCNAIRRPGKTSLVNPIIPACLSTALAMESFSTSFVSRHSNGNIVPMVQSRLKVSRTKIKMSGPSKEKHQLAGTGIRYLGDTEAPFRSGFSLPNVIVAPG
jgi:hypothetical protein